MRKGAIPEEGLARLALRADWTAAEAERAGRHAGGIPDAQAFLRAAGGAGLLPLLYWHGRRAGISWPEPLGTRLRDAYLLSASLAERDLRLLRELSAAFRDAQVRSIVLKGGSFRRTLYEDPALRTMQDLDLWVHPADLGASFAALRRAGFLPRDGDDALRAIREAGCDAVWLRKGLPLPVDLHWGFFHFERCRGAMDLDPDALWRESRVDPEEQAIRHLPAWAELLHLAFHAGAAHGFREALWRLDLRLWIARHGPLADRDRILAEGRRAKALSALAWAVRIAEEDGPIGLDPGFRLRFDGALGPERSLAPLMRASLLAPPAYAGALSRLRTLLALDGWGFRAKAALRGFFPSAALRAYHAARRAEADCRSKTPADP